MSALIYEMFEEHVFVGMDTLSILPDKKSGKYMDKMVVLPSLNGAICLTGWSSVFTTWLAFIYDQTVLKDIFGLEVIAKSMAPSLPEMFKKLNLPDDATSTIFHFGYCEEEKKFKGFAVEVRKEINVRALQYGVAMKACGRKCLNDLKALGDEYFPIREEKRSVFDAMVEIIKRLKTIDESQAIEDQLGIGGEIYVLQMRPGEYIQVKCHRFEDYDARFLEMICNPEVKRHFYQPTGGKP